MKINDDSFVRIFLYVIGVCTAVVFATATIAFVVSMARKLGE